MEEGILLDALAILATRALALAVFSALSHAAGIACPDLRFILMRACRPVRSAVLAGAAVLGAAFLVTTALATAVLGADGRFFLYQDRNATLSGWDVGRDRQFLGRLGAPLVLALVGPLATALAASLAGAT